MPTRPPATPVTDDTAQNLLDWFQINARWLSIGAVIIVVAGAGYWFYARSAEIKAANADRALTAAKQSVAAGNTALAESDLQKLLTGYADTRAGGEAALILAQVEYEQKKFQEGIKVLEDAVDDRGSLGMRSAMYSLIGDGYGEMGKLTESAKSYEKAGDAAVYPNEKAYQRAKAARAYTQAGSKEDAARIWSTLVDSDSEAVAAEARVRLAELTAEPAGRS